MRILAYKPPPARQAVRMDRLICCEPLELEYLYTALKGHDVRLMDGTVSRGDPVAAAAAWRPGAVLLTSFITTVDTVLNTARRIKLLDRGVKILVGGPHAEVVPEHFDSDHVDGVVFADQLNAVRKAVDRIAAGRPFHDVPGLACRHGGRFLRNGAAATGADMPLPERVMLHANRRKYRYMYFHECASLKTAAGCRGGCTFCFCRRMNGGHYSPRDMESVIGEIKSIPVRNVFILDDDFLADADRARLFCRRIREEGIEKRFIAYGTAAAIASERELMEQLRGAGLRAVLVGFEYVTDAALRAVGKRSVAVDNDAVVAVCRELDIELFALFMCGPGWRHRDFRALAAYVRSRGITFASFSTETVFPGTGGAVPEKPCGAFWRYDLLRLHARPDHMPAWAYYLWLYYLYLLPGLHPAGVRRLLRRYGVIGTVRMLTAAAATGAEYLVKLFIWR